LDLARRAVDLQKEAYILDTYAEALYLNNYKRQALAAAKQALKISTKRKQYYEDRVTRFSNF
jgi:hypothetical protein